ncbi:helix-turn-helix domain-containing protein [Lentzea sp. NPDC051838]|uniref:helix-turn-helix domain-containing protein n=1 Tax=Lentzea sp. NPDC051838 TaxID=3154849 RepID=UPI0034328E62
MIDEHGPALVSVPEAARLLGIKRATAYRYAHSGQLPGVRRMGRRLFVVRARLVEFLDPEQDCTAEVEAA